ncbi:hypothetical protein [Streptacidiphilus cavernicola]|uniref:Copper chaperone PCu(A)C n=1 Tax=Streptacidiphilus cavernicola TaxID=3342716 RepID=A0ABV6VTD4_9ACTN
MNAPLHFKQQLADELNARATVLASPAASAAQGGRPAPIRVPRRRLTLTLGAVAAAVAVAVTVPLTGGTHDKQAAAGSSAAPGPLRSGSGNGIDIVTADYVVKSVSDGTVAVKLMNLKGIPGLQAALRKAGIPAAVMEFSDTCHGTVDTDESVDPMKVFPPSADGHYTLIRLSAVPKGEHLLIMELMTPVGGLQPSQLSVVRTVPSCVPASYNDIGAGYVAPGTNP